MSRYHLNIRQIEKLIAENAERKSKLRGKNSNKLLLLMLIFWFLFLAFYQI